MEKRLDDVEGVETIEIRVSEGTATLEATRGKSLRVVHIDRAVKSAGFTPRGMSGTAVGTVERRGETRLLQWEGGEIELLDDHAVLADGRKVRATGALTVDRDGPSTSVAMSVDEVEVVKR